MRNFNMSSGKSENLHFDVTFVKGILCLIQKITEELCVITLKNDAKFEEELTCPLKNDIRKFANFNTSSENSGNLHFNGLLLPKVCNI